MRHRRGSCKPHDFRSKKYLWNTSTDGERRVCKSRAELKLDWGENVFDTYAFCPSEEGKPSPRGKITLIFIGDFDVRPEGRALYNSLR